MTGRAARPTERRFALAPFLIYLDPQMVAGRPREQFDLVLGDLRPSARVEPMMDEWRQLFDAVYRYA